MAVRLRRRILVITMIWPGVGNYVWFDANSNGLQDAGEPGIVDVEVELTITYPDGSQSILRTMTDAAGMLYVWQFTGR